MQKLMGILKNLASDHLVFVNIGGSQWPIPIPRRISINKLFFGNSCGQSYRQTRLMKHYFNQCVLRETNKMNNNKGQRFVLAFSKIIEHLNIELSLQEKHYAYGDQYWRR